MAGSPAFRAFVDALTRPDVPDTITGARSACPLLDAVPEDDIAVLIEEIRAPTGQARRRALRDWWMTVSAWNTPGFAHAVTAAGHGWHHQFAQAPDPIRGNPVADTT